MALRDRLARPVAIAIPAIPAILEASKGPQPARIAKIATIASPRVSAEQASSAAPTEAEEAEIRALLAREMRGAGADHPDYPEALRIALADPGAALEALRAPADSWSADKRAELRAMAQGVE